MEYLHMQRSVTGLWGNETITGVPVSLTAIGSDGTVTSIGTATTNGYYGSFSLSWRPPKQDTYTITATFSGDDSYGSSSAATALKTGPKAETTSTISQQPQTTTDITPLLYAIAGVGVAIILAVAIVGVIILRKR